jgi:hypothetical protein
MLQHRLERTIGDTIADRVQAERKSLGGGLPLGSWLAMLGFAALVSLHGSSSSTVKDRFAGRFAGWPVFRY